MAVGQDSHGTDRKLGGATETPVTTRTHFLSTLLPATQMVSLRGLDRLTDNIIRRHTRPSITRPLSGLMTQPSHSYGESSVLPLRGLNEQAPELLSDFPSTDSASSMVPARSDTSGQLAINPQWNQPPTSSVQAARMPSESAQQDALSSEPLPEDFVGFTDERPSYAAEIQRRIHEATSSREIGAPRQSTLSGTDDTALNSTVDADDSPSATVPSIAAEIRRRIQRAALERPTDSAAAVSPSAGSDGPSDLALETEDASKVTPFPRSSTTTDLRERVRQARREGNQPVQRKRRAYSQVEVLSTRYSETEDYPSAPSAQEPSTTETVQRQTSPADHQPIDVSAPNTLEATQAESSMQLSSSTAGPSTNADTTVAPFRDSVYEDSAHDVRESNADINEFPASVGTAEPMPSTRNEAISNATDAVVTGNPSTSTIQRATIPSIPQERAVESTASTRDVETSIATDTAVTGNPSASTIQRATIPSIPQEGSVEPDASTKHVLTTDDHAIVDTSMRHAVDRSADGLMDASSSELGIDDIERSAERIQRTIENEVTAIAMPKGAPESRPDEALQPNRLRSIDDEVTVSTDRPSLPINRSLTPIDMAEQAVAMGQQSTSIVEDPAVPTLERALQRKQDDSSAPKIQRSQQVEDSLGSMETPIPQPADTQRLPNPNQFEPSPETTDPVVQRKSDGTFNAAAEDSTQQVMSSSKQDGLGSGVDVSRPIVPSRASSERSSMATSSTPAQAIRRAIVNEGVENPSAFVPQSTGRESTPAEQASHQDSPFMRTVQPARLISQQRPTVLPQIQRRGTTDGQTWDLQGPTASSDGQLTAVLPRSISHSLPVLRDHTAVETNLTSAINRPNTDSRYAGDNHPTTQTAIPFPPVQRASAGSVATNYADIAEIGLKEDGSTANAARASVPGEESIHAQRSGHPNQFTQPALELAIAAPDVSGRVQRASTEAVETFEAPSMANSQTSVQQDEPQLIDLAITPDDVANEKTSAPKFDLPALARQILPLIKRMVAVDRERMP